MAKFFRFRQRRVLIDVDTQYDLLIDDGKDRRNLLRNIRRLFAWARVKSIPVISTALTFRSDHTPDETTDFHTLCIEGSRGARKIPYTLRANRIEYEAENRLDLPQDLLSSYDQVIFDKRLPDPFELPRADRLLSEYKADEYIVFGTGLDHAILKTVLGLRQRRRKVSLVIDATDLTGSDNPGMTIRKIESKGARLITTQSIAGESKLNKIREFQMEYTLNYSTAQA